MKFYFWGVLGFIFCFSACATQEIVTNETYNMMGHDLFSNFRFYISKDVVLREIIPPNRDSDRRNTRITITTYNRIVNIKRSTTGRVQGEPSPERLDIAFEQLRDGTRPPITFVQKNNDGRYYFEYTVGNWTVVDRRGNIVTVNGPGIKYNGTEYLLEFRGRGGEPYLLYDQDIKIKKNSRNMRGLR